MKSNKRLKLFNFLTNSFTILSLLLILVDRDYILFESTYFQLNLLKVGLILLGISILIISNKKENMISPFIHDGEHITVRPTK